MRIRTTHTGSLPRPPELAEMILQHDAGADTPRLAHRIGAAVAEVVRRQEHAGIDELNDGEMGKVGYSTYVKDRLEGFEGESAPFGALPELAEHPDFAQRIAALMGNLQLRAPACTAPVRLRDPGAVERDIANLLQAADAAGVKRDRLFMTAASPGVISFFFANQYYRSREAYLSDLAEAMRPEYLAVVNAGITLQLDCPDLAMARHTIFAGHTLHEYRREIDLNVEALNHAVRGIAPEKMRLHVCWGNYEAPHTHDVGLEDIVDVVLRARPLGLSLEASNPRHQHEWAVFEDVELPEGKYLIPGVVDSTTNFVEHPELVAQRLQRYASLVGAERVLAGTDCGFGTFVGLAPVAPTVAWAKLHVLAEGARLVSPDHVREGQ